MFPQVATEAPNRNDLESENRDKEREYCCSYNNNILNIDIVNYSCNYI